MKRWRGGWVAVFLLLGTSRVVQPVTVIHPLVDEVELRYVVPDDPVNHYTPLGTGYDGVVQLIVDTGSGYVGGSGALLSTGRHILTAAHVVDDAVAATVWFDFSTGSESRAASAFFVHPDWDNIINNDIAIVELALEAPAAADRYNIYRNSDEVSNVGSKLGYGATGTGDTGATGFPPVGVKVGGSNRYGSLADIFDGFFFTEGTIVSGTQLAYDFDNGLAANDAFDYFFGLDDLGLGNEEVCSAPGDSGGPTFINNLIAGVTSYGFGFNGGPDVLNGTNSSFGEFAVDTRVSAYSDWIDSIPEPTTIYLLGLGGLALLRKRKR